VFRTDGINVFIAGYREETNADAMNFPCVEAGELLAAVPGVLVATTNVYNAPWIIGAKKGFPNFNECEVRNAIGVSRKLEFRRANLAVDPNQVDNPVAYTNQLFALSVSNSIGTEAWNSYSNTFPRGLRLIVTNEYSLQITNTNALGFATNLYFAAGSDGVLAASTWMGYNTLLPYMPNASSFRVPVNTNLTLAQPNILRLQSASGFTNVTNERFLMAAEAGPYPLPRWRVNLTTRLRYALVDEATGRLVDYVALSQTQPELDLAWELAGRVNSTPLDDSANGAWSTNGLGGSFPEPPNGLSVGLWNQILMGIGQIAFNSLDYRKETAYGTEFFFYNLLNSGSGSPTIFKTNIFYAPFTPFRTIYQRVFWEANDPLVHYTVPDLTDLTSSETVFRTSQGTANIPANTLGGMNRRYSPWAGRPGYPSPPDAYDLSKKDPGMFRPDRWSFPTNPSSDLHWLGSVHRGTPWQTLYLKSPNIAGTDIEAWKEWTGNADDQDAALTSPTNDWRLASMLISLLGTNGPLQLVSVNNPDTNAWLNLFTGLTVLTNSTPDDDLNSN
jgi:hypothetical protein